jgi:hypothetical protein
MLICSDDEDISDFGVYDDTDPETAFDQRQYR